MDKSPEDISKEQLEQAEAVCDRLAMVMHLTARSIEASDISRAIESLEMANQSIQALITALKVADLMRVINEDLEKETAPKDNVFPFPKPNLNPPLN